MVPTLQVSITLRHESNLKRRLTPLDSTRFFLLWSKHMTCENIYKKTSTPCIKNPTPRRSWKLHPLKCNRITKKMKRSNTTRDASILFLCSADRWWEFFMNRDEMCSFRFDFEWFTCCWLNRKIYHPMLQSDRSQSLFSKKRITWKLVWADLEAELTDIIRWEILFHLLRCFCMTACF